MVGADHLRWTLQRSTEKLTVHAGGFDRATTSGTDERRQLRVSNGRRQKRRATADDVQRMTAHHRAENRTTETHERERPCHDSETDCQSALGQASPAYPRSLSYAKRRAVNRARGGQLVRGSSLRAVRSMARLA